jgi:uncharacterized protein
VSIQASFAILQTLHVVDQRIGKLEVKLGSERAGISDKSERHAALLARVAKIESIIVTMEGTRNELNQELRQHLNQVDKAREKMTRCRNEKEANAAQREMEEVRRMSKEREMELQKLVGLITDARADVQAMESERLEVSSHIDETEGLAAVRVRELEADLAEQKKKRQTALGQLPASVQSRYLAVHNRRGSGTAAIVDGTCVACHIISGIDAHAGVLPVRELPPLALRF